MRLSRAISVCLISCIFTFSYDLVIAKDVSNSGKSSSSSQLQGVFDWWEGADLADEADIYLEKGKPEKAFEVMKKAAELGYQRAQYRLGRMYYNGQGTSKDLTKAFKWYKKAAEQEVAEAQNNLGRMYYNGQGTSKDLTIKVRLCELASHNLTVCWTSPVYIIENSFLMLRW